MSVDVYATVLHGEGAGRCVYYTAAEWPDESHHAPDCGGTRSRPRVDGEEQECSLGSKPTGARARRAKLCGCTTTNRHQSQKRWFDSTLVHYELLGM